MEGDKTNRRFSIEWHWGYTTFSDTPKYDVYVYHGTIRDTLDDLGAMPRVTWCRGNIQQKWWNPSDTSFIQFPFFVQIDLQKDINRVHLKFKFLVLIGFWISIGIAWTCLNHRKSCLDVHTISSPLIEALWNGTTRFLWDGGVRVPTLQSRGIIFLVMSSTRDSLNFRGSSFCTAHFWRIFVLNVRRARPHTDNKTHRFEASTSARVPPVVWLTPTSTLVTRRIAGLVYFGYRLQETNKDGHLVGFQWNSWFKSVRHGQLPMHWCSSRSVSPGGFPNEFPRGFASGSSRRYELWSLDWHENNMGKYSRSVSWLCQQIKP